MIVEVSTGTGSKAVVRSSDNAKTAGLTRVTDEVAPLKKFDARLHLAPDSTAWTQVDNSQVKS